MIFSESSGSSNGSKGEGETSTGTYNIFRSAFNRGTELLKSTFLVKTLPAAEKSTSTQLVPTKPSNDTPVTINDSSASSSPAAIESPNGDCSSPDSIKTELMLFKPISCEPRTSSAANTKIIRVPSIRSTSSSSSNFQSPRSSPFFIPITSNRQSAFSFVHIIESPQPPPPPAAAPQIQQPKTIKRKSSTKIASPEKKSEGTSSSSYVNKRQKKMTAIIEEVTPEKRQTRKKEIETVQVVASNEEVKTDSVRETRSRKRNSDPQTENKAEEINVFKSPQKPAKRRCTAKNSLNVVAVDKSPPDDSERRVTRSRSKKI